MKSLLQTGHLYWTCSSQNFVIQVLQKLCPHVVVTGLLNTSRQMEHEKFPSDQEVLAQAIPRHRRQGLCIEQLYISYSLTGREVLTAPQSCAVLLTCSYCQTFCSKMRFIFLLNGRTASTWVALVSNVEFRFLNMTSSPLLP